MANRLLSVVAGNAGVSSKMRARPTMPSVARGRTRQRYRYLDLDGEDLLVADGVDGVNANRGFPGTGTQESA